MMRVSKGHGADDAMGGTVQWKLEVVVVVVVGWRRECAAWI